MTSIDDDDERIDSGVEWAGWHRSASESLIHASRDSDAKCVVHLSEEAMWAGRRAVAAARNERQRSSTQKLIEAAQGLKKLAEEHPEELSIYF
jgi:hypothetical protein